MKWIKVIVLVWLFCVHAHAGVQITWVSGFAYVTWRINGAWYNGPGLPQQYAGGYVAGDVDAVSYVTPQNVGMVVNRPAGCTTDWTSHGPYVTPVSSCGIVGQSTQYTAVGSYTNQTLMVQTVGLRLTFGTNAQPVTNFVTLLPGNSYSFAVTNGAAFSWSVVQRKLEADGLFDYPVASGNGQSQSTFTPAGASSSGLGSFGDTFGSTQQPQGFNPLASGLTNVTRATDFSDTTKAVQTLDVNQQARHREMVSVLMNFENERWRRDAAGINAQAQNAQLVADSAARAGSTVAASVEGLRADLAEGMGDVATLAPVGDPLTTSVGLRSGLAPSLPTVGVGTAQLVVPLAALQLPGLSDHTIDFRQGDLAGWVGTVRAVGVAIVTVAFTVATYRLLFSTGG